MVTAELRVEGETCFLFECFERGESGGGANDGTGMLQFFTLVFRIERDEGNTVFERITFVTCFIALNDKGELVNKVAFEYNFEHLRVLLNQLFCLVWTVTFLYFLPHFFVQTLHQIKVIGFVEAVDFELFSGKEFIHYFIYLFFDFFYFYYSKFRLIDLFLLKLFMCTDNSAE